MDLGMVGLGRMGANLVRRLLRDGHRAVAYDVHPEAIAALVSEGADGAATLAELADKLARPRAVWVMVPAGLTGQVIEDVAELLDEGDIIIDGGNSFYQDDLTRSASLAERGIRLLLEHTREIEAKYTDFCDEVGAASNEGSEKVDEFEALPDKDINTGD